jgi:hypothetical protein
MSMEGTVPAPTGDDWDIARKLVAGDPVLSNDEMTRRVLATGKDLQGNEINDIGHWIAERQSAVAHGAELRIEALASEKEEEEWRRDKED